MFSRRKLPVVLQSEHSECGLACLAMVAAYHGHGISMTQLRQRYPISQRGSTLRDIMTLAQWLGLSVRAVKVAIADIENLKSPAILHWDLDHFVVLKRARHNRFDIHNPALGARQYRQADLSAHFTGIALELTPRPDFVPQPPTPRLKLNTLLRDCRRLTVPMVQIIGLSIFIQAFALVAPFYLQFVVDEVLVKQDHALLSTLAIGFAGLMLLSTTTKALRGFSTTFIANSLSVHVNSSLFGHLIRLPMRYFSNRHVGDVISRFDSLKPIQEFITGGAVAAGVDGLMAITTALLMFAYAPGLTAVVVAFLGLYAGLRIATFAMLRARQQESLSQHASLDAHFIETIRSLQSIKVAGREEERANLWQNRLIDACNTDVRIARLQISLETLRSVINGSEIVLVVFLGAGLVLESGFTVGMLYAFMAYRSHFSGAVGNLVDEFIRFRMLGLHLERVADIGHTRIEACFDEAATFGPPLRGVIELDDVSFRYSATGPLILESLSLQIAEHRLIAISGASGCGKSTLLKILLGLLEPTTGRLLVAGTLLTPARLRSHRSAIGAVLQEDAPYSGSIIDNVSHFDPQPDLPQIQACCTLAEIHRDIVAMPMGYHSMVGDMGAALSAGQRQRVLLARALYHNPSIVLLDEGTSHIDTATAIKIIQNLQARDLTCVCVTHSEALLALADEVIYLEPGGTLARTAPPTQARGKNSEQSIGDEECLPPRAAQRDV